VFFIWICFFIKFRWN